MSTKTQINTTHHDMDSLEVEVDGDIIRISDSEAMLEFSAEMMKSIYSFVALASEAEDD